MAAALSGLPTISEALGARLFGTGVDTLLLGVVSHQVCTYAAEYGSTDSIFLRLYVAGLLCLVWAKSALNLVYVWQKVVFYFGNPLDVLPVISQFEIDIVGALAILVISIVCYSQIYYIYRLYSISRNNIYLTTAVALMAFAAFSLSFAGAMFLITQGAAGADRAIKFIYAAYPIVITGDICLSGITAFFLLRFRKKAFAATASKLTRLIVLIFQSALPATTIAILDCVLTYVLPSLSPIPSSLLMMLADLWAFSVMWTLNARNDRRTRIRTIADSQATAVGSSIQKSSRVSMYQPKAHPSCLLKLSCLFMTLKFS